MAIVVVALCPALGYASENWPPVSDNYYHPGADVNEYIVFAESTWPWLWNDRDDTERELYTNVHVSDDEVYEPVQTFLAWSWAFPEGGSQPTAKLFVGPGNKCVISFRPSLMGESGVEGWGALAVVAEYPILGVVRAFFTNALFPYTTATDVYYHDLIEQIGGSINSEVQEHQCDELTSVGYSMGASLAQLYAYRSWVFSGSHRVSRVVTFNPGPTGNQVFRHEYNSKVKSLGVENQVFCRNEDPVKRNSAWAYGAFVESNWELGCTHTGASVDAYYNQDGPPVDHDLRAWRTCGIHISADQQCPGSETETAEWLESDPDRGGKSGAYAGNFVFTVEGMQPADYQCVNIGVAPPEASDWDDNYFCSWQEIDMEWSTQGPIDGKECTEIPTDAIYGDTYLCIQENSSYVFTWYTQESDIEAGQRCIEWYEPSDGSYWGDGHFLCWKTNNQSLVDSLNPPAPIEVIPVPPPNNPPNSGDQCDTTGQCRDEYGDGATDCRDSNSSSSVCMCGAERCDAGDDNDNDNDNGNGNSDNGNSNNGNDSGDQCDTTGQCREQYGDGATDCRDSNSSSSVCICGANRCDGH